MKKLIAVTLVTLMMTSVTGCSLFTEKSEVVYTEAEVIDMHPDYSPETIDAYAEVVNQN